jgi:DNA-binding response OmpR family regulator
MITGTLAAILNVSGMAALTAEDGLEALEIARLIPPEILIADLTLPGLNGLELAVQVTRIAPDCEVILLVGNSAIPSLNAMAGSLRRRFKILPKPTHPADLLEAVFALLIPHGHALTRPREVRARSPYDLLTSVRPESDAVPVGVNVTRRQCSASPYGH